MMTWKPNWPQSKQHFVQWWNRKGMVICPGCPADKPNENIPKPPVVEDQEKAWTDPTVRADQSEWVLSTRWFGSDSIPIFDSQIGPGSLGMFLGAIPHFAPGTVWFEPCISDPDKFGPIRFDASNRWFKVHMDVIQAGLDRSRGRFIVPLPDMIENIDTLAAMRGTEEMLFDLLEKPAWIHRCLEEITQAFFDSFDVMYQKVQGQIEGPGNAWGAFGIWGPGKTAKVQADFSAMISAEMFNEFVKPYLTAQCDWLDYSMYHLDGTNALQHLDTLLSIESLDAIEWTPQAGLENGGHQRWFDIYKRIKQAGKAMQVINVRPEEVEPLLDTIGPEGMFILANVKDQKTAEKMVQTADKYR